MILYVQRGSRHYPNPPQCALLASDTVIIILFDIHLILNCVLYLLMDVNIFFIIQEYW